MDHVTYHFFAKICIIAYNSTIKAQPVSHGPGPLASSFAPFAVAALSVFCNTVQTSSSMTDSVLI